MENIERVTRHSLHQLSEQQHPEAYRRTLTCIPALDGKSFARDAAGNFWRTYPFIERTRSLDVIETAHQATQAARAFGAFQNQTASLPGPRLHETIPYFHHTAQRLADLQQAILADPLHRASALAAEIDFALERSADCHRIVDLIASGEIPERITHNDTKLNNLLLDDITDEGVCVIDLDTTMPGCSLYDFGDMVRNSVAQLPENATDFTSTGIRLDIYQALLCGYLSTAHFLNEAEKNHLAFSGKLLTLECGIRFLTDYLLGDCYFKIKNPSQNLDRCRNQFALVRALESRMPMLEDVTAQIVETAKHQHPL
jgi:Ser/Thr protein kinase RdoA (MazF antagonist)